MKIRICFRVRGLAVDEDGNPAPAGICLSVGESDEPVDYQRLTKDLDKEAFLRMTCLDKIVGPEDMELITPEEYDQEFGEGESE